MAIPTGKCNLSLLGDSGCSHTPVSLEAFEYHHAGALFRALGGDQPRETEAETAPRTACKGLGPHSRQNIWVATYVDKHPILHVTSPRRLYLASPVFRRRRLVFGFVLHHVNNLSHYAKRVVWTLWGAWPASIAWASDYVYSSILSPRARRYKDTSRHTEPVLPTFSLKEKYDSRREKREDNEPAIQPSRTTDNDPHTYLYLHSDAS